MKIRLVAAAAVAAVLACAGQSFADDASNYQIDAAHDGQIRFAKDFHAPLKQRWTKDLGGTVSYPVFGSGMVFVSVDTGSGIALYALKQKNGDVVWHVNLADGGSPAFENGMVYVIGFNGLLQAYNAKDGTLAYAKQQVDEFDFTRTLTASDGLVYFTGAGEAVELYAAKEKKGKAHFESGGPAGSSIPAVGGGNVYVAYSCDEEAYDASKGTFKWEHATCEGGGGGTPVYFDNRVYADDGTNQVVLDAETGALVRPFVHEEFVPAFWTPASGDPLGFVVDGNAARLTAFDATTGDTAWSVDPKSFSTPPLVINDTVFVGDFNGNLHAFDAATGTELWSKNIAPQIGGTFSFPPGMGAGGDMLLVPAGNTISAWVPKR